MKAYPVPNCLWCPAFRRLPAINAGGKVEPQIAFCSNGEAWEVLEESKEQGARYPIPSWCPLSDMPTAQAHMDNTPPATPERE
jgi:hypothetical protein